MTLFFSMSQVDPGYARRDAPTLNFKFGS